MMSLVGLYALLKTPLRAITTGSVLTLMTATIITNYNMKLFRYNLCSMETKELMIGDLVQVPSELNRHIRIRSTFDMDSAVLYKPIQLTPEILEKNGFVQDGESWWYQDFRIVLSTSKGESLVCGRQVKFCYIHQLQHALRLCGIEKEIEL